MSRARGLDHQAVEGDCTLHFEVGSGWNLGIVKASLLRDPQVRR